MRRLVLILAGLFAGLALIAATLPWWLGRVIRPAAQARGYAIGEYERIGYTRFALQDVVVPVGRVHVTVARVEADTPLLWLWRHWRGQDAPVEIGTWRVEIGPAGAPGDPDKPRGWLPLRALLQRIADELGRWLPQATVGEGGVRWPGGEIGFASATWNGQELVADDLKYAALTVDATVAFADNDVIRIEARTTDGVAAARLESHGAGVSGEAELWAQRAAVGATFPPRGWLPTEASLRASEWSVAGDKLKVGGAYRSIQGSIDLTWKNPSLDVNLTATGEPEPGRNAPPLDVALRGSGDRTGFTLASLRVQMPGISARLTEPVEMERSGRFRAGSARFTLQADLAQLPWGSARGTVAGEARLASGVTDAPAVEFEVSAEELQAGGVQLQAASARGRLDWPRFEITAGEVRMSGGGAIAWRGGWDFSRREIFGASIEGTVRRDAFARWLPSQPDFGQVELKATAEGPLNGLAHRGSLRAANVTLPRLQPVEVAGEWRGLGATLESWNAAVRAGVSEITARGALGDATLTLTEMSLRQGDAVRLALTAPAIVRWRPGIQIDSVQLAGPDGRIRGTVTLGAAGRIDLAAEHIASPWFSDFVTLPGPAWTLTRLGLTGQWDRGPAQFAVDAAAALEIGDDRTAVVEVQGGGAADGLRIEALRVRESDATVVDARGRLPLAWVPAGDPAVRIDPGGELTLDANVAPHPVFWNKIAELTGVTLEDPRVQAKVSGTWERPVGHASLQAVRVAIEPRWTTRPLPVIEGLHIEVDGDRGGLNLTRFDVRVAEQAVRGQGRLPVPDDGWRDLIDRPIAVARNGADLHLEIPEADLAALARFLPAVMAPKGRFEADVRFRNGGLEGFLRLRDAATKALGPLGIVQEISADVRLAGRRFTFDEVSARSGGQPVTLTGFLELGDDGTPRFDFALRGNNLPFVRQTGLLVRGDLDLELKTPAEAEPARLSGTVRLRDSLFLSDVRDLLPQGGAGPARRPPYFALEMPPVNAWNLAVEVTGDRFMRVRSPVFSGVASARFRLSGTLGEPRAIGEVVIDEGTIKMPFASFTVTQGTIRLTELNAYEPEVYLRGSGRRYGYDLSIEIEGPASQPAVLFSSSPALDAEQVLLMVMAGTAPGNEVSRTSTQRAANIGLFLGQSILSSLGADAAEADRLTLMSGEKVSRQGRETYEFEYQLTDRWKLTGEYNEFDEYNAGVKWRVFGGRPPAPKPDESK